MLSLLWQFGHFITTQGKEGKKGKLSEDLDLLSHGNRSPGWYKTKRDGVFPSHTGKSGEIFQTHGSGPRSSRTQVCPDTKQIIPLNYRINLATEYRFMFRSSEIRYIA